MEVFISLNMKRQWPPMTALIFLKRAEIFNSIIGNSLSSSSCFFLKLQFNIEFIFSNSVYYTSIDGDDFEKPKKPPNKKNVT